MAAAAWKAPSPADEPGAGGEATTARASLKTPGVPLPPVNVCRHVASALKKADKDYQTPVQIALKGGATSAAPRAWPTPADGAAAGITALDSPPSTIPEEFHVYRRGPVLPDDADRLHSSYDASTSTWTSKVFPAALPYHRNDAVLLEEFYDAQRDELEESSDLLPPHHELRTDEGRSEALRFGGAPGALVAPLRGKFAAAVASVLEPDAEAGHAAREGFVAQVCGRVRGVADLGAMCMGEVARQVATHCTERGALVNKLWADAEGALRLAATAIESLHVERRESIQNIKRLEKLTHVRRSAVEKREKELDDERDAHRKHLEEQFEKLEAAEARARELEEQVGALETQVEEYAEREKSSVQFDKVKLLADELANAKKRAEVAEKKLELQETIAREREAQHAKEQATVEEALADARESAALDRAKYTPRPQWRVLNTVRRMLEEGAWTEDELAQSDSTVAAERIDRYATRLAHHVDDLKQKLAPPPPDRFDDAAGGKKGKRGNGLNFEVQEKFFVCNASGANVPKYLRFNGKVRNRNLSKQAVRAAVADIWRTKHADASNRRTKMREFLYLYIQRKYGALTPVIAEWGYNIVHGLMRFGKLEADTSDIYVFWEILNDRQDEEVLHDLDSTIETLRATFRDIDRMSRGVTSGRVKGVDFEAIMRRMFPYKNPERMAELMAAAKRGGGGGGATALPAIPSASPTPEPQDVEDEDQVDDACKDAAGVDNGESPVTGWDGPSQPAPDGSEDARRTPSTPSVAPSVASSSLPGSVAYEDVFVPMDREGNRPEFQLILLRQTLAERDELVELYRMRFALMDVNTTGVLTREQFLMCMRNVDPEKAEYANRSLLIRGFGGGAGNEDEGRDEFPPPEASCAITDFVERLRRGVLRRSDGGGLDRRERRGAAQSSARLPHAGESEVAKKAGRAFRKVRNAIRLSMLPSFSSAGVTAL